MSEDPNIYRTLGPVYISSIQPLLDKKNLFEEYKIKTIISITKSDIPDEYKQAPYNHLQIPIDDLPTEIILPHIPAVNKLILKTIYTSISNDEIQNALVEKEKLKPSLSGDAVLIHCQSGISRSVGFLCAYLMNRHNLPLSHALHAIRRNNPQHTFQPNDGFIEQLEIYKESDWCVDVQKLRKISQRWRAYRMEYLISNILQNNLSNNDDNDNNLDDGSNQFSVVDDSLENKDDNWFGFKCAKCRSLLASSEVFIPHAPPFDKDDKQMYFTKNAYRSKRVINRQQGQAECTHIFTEPLIWMREKIVNETNNSNGDFDQLEGRLDCYKCCSKIGGWNWKGGRCSCGKWMVPAIHLLKSKVVQVDKNGKLILKSDDRAV